MFYINHEINRFLRRKDLGQVIFLGLFILFYLFVLDIFIGKRHDDLLINLSKLVDLELINSYQLLLVLVLLLCFALFTVMSPSISNIEKYLMWNINKKILGLEFILFSIFSAVLFSMAILFFSILFNTEHLAKNSISPVGVFVHLIALHYIGVSYRYSHKGFKVLGVFFAIFIIFSLILFGDKTNFGISTLIACLSIFYAYQIIIKYLNRPFPLSRKKFSTLSFLNMDFKHPLDQVEWALVSRNKRTRSNLIAGFVSIIFLMVITYRDNEINKIYAFIFPLLVTGTYLFQHGLYSLGWEANYFDTLNARFSTKEIIQHRYKTYLKTILIGTLITSLLCLIKPDMLYFIIPSITYNLGINIPVIMINSMFNVNKLDLSSSSMFNYQGFSGRTFLMSSIMVLIPMIGFYILSNIIGELNAIMVFTLLGLPGIIFSKFLLKRIGKLYDKRKYKLAEMFLSS